MLTRHYKTARLAGNLAAVVVFVVSFGVTRAFADPVPGGTLEPTSIPKYVTPLVIPPVMNNDGAADSYDIAVRQFQQQILPGGLWNALNGRSDDFPATTVWSYGPAADPVPDASALGVATGIAPAPNSQFNYPSYTIETSSQPTLGGTPVNVRWINDLVDAKGHFLSHLLPIDQTVHWANPPQACADGTERTDCSGKAKQPYKGPVPIITHVHGAHVNPESDGYPEAWYLPAAKNIPASYATSGRLFDDVTGTNPGNLGYADFSYRNDQPATTLWYHDHSLGMTRLNVYAGPAGFWLVRGGPHDLPGNQLPGPAPVAGEGVLALNVPGDPVRNKIREIPIVVQDRSFNTDGSLFYPPDRGFFEGLGKNDFKIQFAPETDVLPIINPEAFFNVMVVNGVSWPSLDVAQDRYRFRLLNGCNSRTLNLALFVVNPDGTLGEEIPFYQIGAEQGFLPQVVKVQTGLAVALPGDGTTPPETPDPTDQTALLMGLAERADVIVDFSGLPDGTVVRMINTGPDEAYGGFPADPADPGTTGQVMQFVVDEVLTGTLGSSDGTTTAPESLVLPSEIPLGATDNTRQVSLSEREDSAEVCVPVDAEGNFVLDKKGKLKQINKVKPGPDFEDDCAAAGGVSYGPIIDTLGTVTGTGVDATGVPLKWTDTTGTSSPVTVFKVDGTTVTVLVTENPTLGDVEEWQIHNFTPDAHPIHLHLVRFQVVSRTLPDGSPSTHTVEPWEAGFKDTVVAYPGEITTVKAHFDIEGLYVWHCHILEHEDNEMMRPYVVSAPD